MRESCLRTSGERSTEFHQMNLLCFKVLYKKSKDRVFRDVDRKKMTRHFQEKKGSNTPVAQGIH